MDDKILTISIAAYNVEKYLKETLDSLIVDSAMNKMEILVIDDGSKDSTRAIAKEYADRYPDSIFVISKENGGWGSTVNCGIRNAHGRYFRLLDGDDRLITENLASFISYLEIVDADIILSSFVREYENSGRQEIIFRHSFNTDRTYKLAETQVDEMYMLEMTVRTTILQNNDISISEREFYTDNEYVFFSVLYASSIAIFAKTVYSYRIGVEGQSVSLEGRKRHWQSGEIVAKKLISIYNTHKAELSGQKNKLLYQTLLNITSWQYMTYILMDASEKTKKCLIEFDTWLKKELPELYDTVGKMIKTVQWLRRSHFVLYSILHVYIIKKYVSN